LDAAWEGRACSFEKCPFLVASLDQRKAMAAYSSSFRQIDVRVRFLMSFFSFVARFCWVQDKIALWSIYMAWKSPPFADPSQISTIGCLSF
jgi:hypothetical protein